MAGLLPQQVLRSTLRSVGCPICCLPPRLLRLHVGPLPSLRTFVRRPLSTVTVRAQRSGLAEGKRAALAASFAELGLGQDLLTFLAESRLGSPTEIQVCRCRALLRLCRPAYNIQHGVFRHGRRAGLSLADEQNTVDS